MKAVGVKRYGGVEVLEDFVAAEPPAPTGYDILVRVHAVSVNPVDWKIRAGWFDEPSKTFDPPKVSTARLTWRDSWGGALAAFSRGGDCHARKAFLGAAKQCAAPALVTVVHEWWCERFVDGGVRGRGRIARGCSLIGSTLKPVARVVATLPPAGAPL